MKRGDIVFTYTILKKEFTFLKTDYNFKIYMKQKHGSYYFIIWTNMRKNIMVLYDLMVETPITIRVFDADSLGIDADEYGCEFVQSEGSPREKIRCAADWLKKAITDQYIEI